MRANAYKRAPREEEEESVFISMTDMTVSFLFIVILLLAFFASQYDPTRSVPLPEHERVLAERDALAADLAATKARLAQVEPELARLRDENAVLKDQTAALTLQVEVLQRRIAELESRISELEAELARLRQPDPLETYINQSLVERRKLLESLRDRLRIDFPDLQVVLSEESDALRFQGDGLFRSGSSVLRPDRRDFVEGVAIRLNELLPCYTLGVASRWRDGCNAGYALIEAVQIEGHTDADGDALVNLALSTARANGTFGIMQQREAALLGHLNFRNQPVLSVAGYGEMRPVAANTETVGKAQNRRIDLRIIMYVPRQTDEIEIIRDALATAGGDE